MVHKPDDSKGILTGQPETSSLTLLKWDIKESVSQSEAESGLWISGLEKTGAFNRNSLISKYANVLRSVTNNVIIPDCT